MKKTKSKVMYAVWNKDGDNCCVEVHPKEWHVIGQAMFDTRGEAVRWKAKSFGNNPLLTKTIKVIKVTLTYEI